jgi:hypothetical protein
MITSLPSIKIEGAAGSGTTIIAHTIAESLEKYGITCPIIDSSNESSHEEALSRIGLFIGKSITIESVQTKLFPQRLQPTFKELQERIQELEKEIDLLKNPPMNKLTLSAKDIRDLDLSGRIIFKRGEIDAETLSIEFYCGPETIDGYLLDYDDCGLYQQLEMLFDGSEFDVYVGEAENKHAVYVEPGSSCEETWKEVERILVDAGAIPMIDNE